MVPARPAAVAGIAMWVAGLVLYLGIMVSVVTRLLRAGLAPGDAIAAYWVAMGAASISAFAAARLVLAVAAVLPAARPAVAGGGVAAWVPPSRALATIAFPALINDYVS